jgi:dihydrofolate reductase
MQSKNNLDIDHEQIELLEYAQKRIRQKKFLYYHFVLFLFVSVIVLSLDYIFNIASDINLLEYSWSFWIVFSWFFLFIFHVFNVYVTGRFINKSWIKNQKNKLIKIQKLEIENIKAKMDVETKIKAETDFINKKTQLITIIVAASENNVIGNNNKLIWHLSDDLKRFKNLTKGHYVIMGRKTFESMPRALPNRTNVIITRKKNYIAENAIVTNSLESALKIASDDAQPFIIGGGEIYNIALNISDRIELTRIHHNFEGDTTFPEINKEEWIESNRVEKKKDETHSYDFTFITYNKIKK